jgi:hypothetical protein
VNKWDEIEELYKTRHGQPAKEKPSLNPNVPNMTDPRRVTKMAPSAADVQSWALFKNELDARRDASGVRFAKSVGGAPTLGERRSVRLRGLEQALIERLGADAHLHPDILEYVAAATVDVDARYALDLSVRRFDALMAERAAEERKGRMGKLSAALLKGSVVVKDDGIDGLSIAKGWNPGGADRQPEAPVAKADAPPDGLQELIDTLRRLTNKGQ